MSTNYGVIVTLPGYDYDTATPEQCALHSKYANPKVQSDASPGHFGTYTHTFTTNYTAGTRNNMLTVKHNLGFVPMVVCSWAWDFGIYGPPVGTQYGEGNLTVINFPFDYVDIYADSTNFYIDFVSDGASALDETTLSPMTFRYYIFSEDGV